MWRAALRHLQMSETARLRMKMFLGLQSSFLLATAQMTRLLPRKVTRMRRE